MYLGGLVPAIAGILCSELTRVTHVTWAVLVLLAEVGSHATYFLSHRASDAWTALAMSIPIFFLWPGICLLSLPFLRAPVEPTG